MVVGIDIRVLGNSIKSGIEEYTENLLAHLLPLDPDIKYKLFYSSLHSKLPRFGWLSLDNVELKIFHIPNRILFNSARIFGRPFIDKLMGGIDVFFSPHFFIAPLSSNCKRITTIHDLSFMRFKDLFSWRQNLWHKLEMDPLWQSRFSDAIITPSNSTKRDLEEIFKIDPQKVSVIYSGINHDMEKPEDIDLEKFRVDKNLPRNFILYLGKIEPRKNTVGLIRAFNRLKETSRFSNLDLIIMGAKGWLYKDVIKEANKSPHKQNIIFTGHVEDGEKRYYYSLARCFVYPSFFEGFGFPNLEAMRCETPVLTSNNSSIPEIVTDHALLVNPYSVDDICRGLSTLLTDQNLSKNFVIKGKNFSKQYTWHTSAVKTLNLIESVY